MNFKFFTFVQSPPVAIISQPSQPKSTSQAIENASPPVGLFPIAILGCALGCFLKFREYKKQRRELEQIFEELEEIETLERILETPPSVDQKVSFEKQVETLEKIFKKTP